MSTRGAFGFRYLNTDKTCTNSTDSDLWGLGTNAVDAIVTNSNESLLEHFHNISFENTTSTFDGENVFFQKNYKDATTFLGEGLFCEWAYILNLDSYKLEIYSGFHAPEGRGRYNKTAQECSKRYGGVALVCEVSFDTIRALFTKPKYAALAAKFYGVVNAKAELTKEAFEFSEDLAYSAEKIDEYFASLQSIDTSKITVSSIEAGVEFTCAGRKFLKISHERYAAVALNYFCLYSYDYFEDKPIFLSN